MRSLQPERRAFSASHRTRRSGDPRARRRQPHRRGGAAARTAGGGETAGTQRGGGGKPEQRSSRAGDGGAESAAAGVGAEARRGCRRLGVAAARRRGDERGRGRRGRWRRLVTAAAGPRYPVRPSPRRPLSLSLSPCSLPAPIPPHPLSPARPFRSPPGCVRSHEQQRRRVLRLRLLLLVLLLLDSGNGGGGGCDLVLLGAP